MSPAAQIEGIHTFTCRASLNDGFQARCIVSRRDPYFTAYPQATGQLVVKIIEGETRGVARRRMEAWLNQPDGLSPKERARNERQARASGQMQA